MESIPQAVDTLSAAIATILTGGVAFFIGWEGGVRACRASAAYRPFARGFQNRPAGNSSAVDPRQIHLNVVIGAMVISGGVFYGVWKWRILKANEAIGNLDPQHPLPTSISEANNSIIPSSHQTHQLFLYTDGSPEATPISICLEELGLAYCALPISESETAWTPGEPESIPILLDRNPKSAALSSMSPRRSFTSTPRSNGGQDTDGIEVFGGQTVVMYLCDKYGSNLLSTDAKLRSEAMGWANFALRHLGPAASEYLYCMTHCPFVPQFERARLKLLQVLATLERRLRERRFLSGRDFSVADLMAVPWVSALEKIDRCWDDLLIPKMTNLVQWYSSCRLRPSMSIGMRVGSNEMFGAYRSYSSQGKVAKAHC